jgi:hypothetical protein
MKGEPESPQDLDEDPDANQLVEDREELQPAVVEHEVRVGNASRSQRRDGEIERVDDVNRNALAARWNISSADTMNRNSRSSPSAPARHPQRWVLDDYGRSPTASLTRKKTCGAPRSGLSSMSLATGAGSQQNGFASWHWDGRFGDPLQ